jgi:NAD(P)-dependent dehydrogenase (short-subunit alcohol dehydrogenase family)
MRAPDPNVKRLRSGEREPLRRPIDLEGRVAIVTGGATGIGAACCRALADCGARVVAADLRASEGAGLCDELTAEGADAMFVETDVASEGSAIDMARRTLDRHGAVDVLVNNAGLYRDLERKLPFDQITTEQWDRVMAVNVRGAWNCAKAVFPAMHERGYGKLVNVSSSSVHLGVAGLAHYVASKAALIGLTHALARELGPAGVRVNAIAPGVVSNEASRALNPDDAYLAAAARGRALAREMLPGDLMGTIAFLASPASDFMTGQTLVVDGGAVMQ